MTDPTVRHSVLTLGTGDDLARLRAEVEKVSGLVRQLADISVPMVVDQALADVQLPDAARLLMWHLSKRLVIGEYREVYAESLASESRRKITTVGQMLTLLVHRGYLDESVKRKPRAFRLPSSRRASVARAA